MNKYNFDYKYELALGALSGFNPCCIAWYFLRNNITRKSRWRYLIEFIAFDKYGSGYIPCPYHALTKDKPWSICDKCNWKQLNKGSCRLCLIKDYINCILERRDFTLCNEKSTPRKRK